MLHAIRKINWTPWRKRAGIFCAVMLVLLLIHECLVPIKPLAHLGSLALKLLLLGLFAWAALLWDPHPLTLKKLQRFRSIKRGFYSFVLVGVLFFISLFAELLMHSRALMVSYEGKLYFPTYTAFHPGTDFGETYQREVKYRDLQAKFREAGEGNWVLMPIVPWDPYERDFDPKNRPPTAPSFSQKHFLGTDNLGRDVLVRLFYGFRIMMICSLVYMTAVYFIGIVIGCLMGYFGGLTDLIGQRFVEIWANIPFLYMVIITVAFIPPSLDANLRIGLLICVMITFQWTSMTYYMRTSTFKEKARDYTAAARLLGASTARIIFTHIFPNTIATVVTFIPFTVSFVIISLTALDYLNFGIPVPEPSWGELLKQGTSSLDAWWITTFTFIVVVSVLSLVTFVGEAVREAFDPRKFTIYR